MAPGHRHRSTRHPGTRHPGTWHPAPWDLAPLCYWPAAVAFVPAGFIVIFCRRQLSSSAT
jgi:hypothetical protein